jgi:hypothetical protein
MNTTKLARRLVLGIGIPAALATGAIAASASSNGSPSSDQATTITQTAPASTDAVTIREPGEDVQGNTDEAEHRSGANEPGDDNGQNQWDDHGQQGQGDQSTSGLGGSDDSSGHDGSSGHAGDGGSDD